MKTKHYHHTNILNILHHLLLIILILLQPVPYKSKRPFMPRVQAVLPIELELNILVSFVQRVVSQVHHYFIVVVFIGWLVFLCAEARHAFFGKEDGVGLEVGYEDV